MAVTAAQVKELRDRTGAGMLDCKNALAATDGDIEMAIDWLREKGIAKSIKKASRIAAEGLSKVLVDGNKACLVEINSETDFVAKNEQFLKLLDTAVRTILENDPADNDAALALKVGEGTLNDEFINATATIGEKISFRRFERITKNDDEVFGTYKHMGGKIGTIVIVKGANEEVAKDVAMQAAAMNPIALKRDEVPSELVEKEKHFIEEEVKQQSAGKPDAVIQKMVAGKLEKYYKEVVLVEQAFIKENKLSVEKYVKDNGGEVISMTRFAVGEGIEKRVENFAEEVMSQING